MPSTVPRVLVACLLVVVAGCAGTPTQDPTTPPTETTKPASTSTSTSSPSTASTTTQRTTTDRSHDRWVRGNAVEVSAATVAAETSRNASALDVQAERIVRRTVANDAVTLTTVRETFDGSTRPVVVNGTYYDVNRTTVETETVTVHTFEIEGPLRKGSDVYSRAKSAAVAVENLSAADRAVFKEGLPAREDLDSVSFTIHFPYHYEGGTPPASATFADGDVHFVAYEGHYFRVAFDDTNEQKQRTYRYTASVVAENASAYKAVALDRYVTNVSNASISGAAREVLLQTLENGSINFHSENPSVPDEYERFYRWTREHPFVEYEGEYYWLQIYKVME